MENISFYFAFLLLFISIELSVSIQYVPADKNIEVVHGQNYTFGIDYDRDLELAECIVISNTGIIHWFTVWPKNQIYNKEDQDTNIKTTWFKDLGKDGLCQISVFDDLDSQLLWWNLVALNKDKEIVANTTFTVNIILYDEVQLHTSFITMMNAASFFNYMILPDDTEIKSCQVKINNGIIVDLDPHTPRINTKHEKISRKISSLGQGLCGLRYTNATQELTGVKWTLTAESIREGKIYEGTFFTQIESMETNFHFKRPVSLGQEYTVQCYPNNTFCHIFNPAGKLVESNSCNYTILSVKMKDLGLWKCHTLFWNSMEAIETSTIELIATGSNDTVLSWANETEYYFHIGCQTSRYVNKCRMIMPNGKMLRVDTGYATDRHLAFGTNLTKGICSIMISKPLQESEKGSWKCELRGKNSNTTGSTISVGDAKPVDYPKYLELSARLSKPLTINCEVPYSTDYCRIVSPNGTKYLPDKLEQLNLGRCSHHIRNTTIADKGAWMCMFARETGLTDEKIVVNVTIGEFLQYNSVERVPLYGDAELLCKTDEVPLDYCRFSNLRGESYHIRDSDSGSSRISYYGRGLNYGECGIRILNVTRYEGQLWTCITQPLPNDNAERKGEINLIIL